MPGRTPKFVGSRLREAREARQITGVALAELIGVTKAAISSYERGQSSPSPETFDKIARQLDFKHAFFLRPEDVTGAKGPQTYFERSRSSTTKSTRQRARHRLTWLREIVRYLHSYLNLPRPDLPPLGEHHWLALSDRDIENAAQDTRKYWNLGDGPISNVTLLSEKHGVIVTSMVMNAAKLDAFSTWDQADDRPYIVLGTDKQSAFRTRFNVCHELGHLILHKTLSQVDVNDRSGFKAIESQANRFASAFLAPDRTFSADIAMPSLELFRTLKPRWQVSIKMMIHRAHALDIIDREEARRLYINYNQRGWNRQEPLDDSHPLEEPRLVRRAFEMIVEESVLDGSQIQADLPFNRVDIESLANLPHGYLSDESAYNWAVRDAYNWAIREIENKKE